MHACMHGMGMGMCVGSNVSSLAFVVLLWRVCVTIGILYGDVLFCLEFVCLFVCCGWEVVGG